MLEPGTKMLKWMGILILTGILFYAIQFRMPFMNAWDTKKCLTGLEKVYRGVRWKIGAEDATNRQNEISALLNRVLGVRPKKLYPALEGINIVYSTPDYMTLGIEVRAEGLKKEIYALAEKYFAEKYQEIIINTSYVRFLHPEMPGYNGYYLWLG